MSNLAEHMSFEKAGSIEQEVTIALFTDSRQGYSGGYWADPLNKVELGNQIHAIPPNNTEGSRQAIEQECIASLEKLKQLEKLDDYNCTLSLGDNSYLLKANLIKNNLEEEAIWQV